MKRGRFVIAPNEGASNTGEGVLFGVHNCKCEQGCFEVTEMQILLFEGHKTVKRAVLRSRKMLALLFEGHIVFKSTVRTSHRCDVCCSEILWRALWVGRIYMIIPEFKDHINLRSTVTYGGHLCSCAEWRPDVNPTVWHTWKRHFCLSFSIQWVRHVELINSGKFCHFLTSFVSRLLWIHRDL